jgi:hypothetical protein
MNDSYDPVLSQELLVAPRPRASLPIATTSNPHEWDRLEKLLNAEGAPLIPVFCYTKVPRVMPLEVQEIVNEYLLHLKKEKNIDISLNDGNAHRYEVYLVLTADLTQCAGIFIVRKADYSLSWAEFLRTHKSAYDHLKNKTNKDPFFSQPHTVEEEENYFIEQKMPGYRQHLFYLRAKHKLTGREAKCPILDSVWIHPNFRRKGLFKAFFGYLRNQWSVLAVRETPDTVPQLKRKNMNYSEPAPPMNAYPYSDAPDPSHIIPACRLLA